MISFEYRPEEKFILTIFSGNVSGEDMANYFGELLNIDHDSGNIRGLSVFCNSVRFRAFEIPQIINAARSLHGAKFTHNSSNAIVCYSSKIHRLARIYEFSANMRRKDDTRVFKDSELRMAISWLEIDNMYDSIHEAIQKIA